jgi:uracil-DNA glycosylase
MKSTMNGAHTTRRAAQRSAADFLPEIESLSNLIEAAKHCEGCDLYKRATQTVFGEGRSTAQIILVGEVPGDQEDLAGKPFVGPAGRLLDDALAEAGINRKIVYVTNAVKHFKWEPRGKRRLHAKPSAREITACRPWLEAEIRTIEPRTIVCLGATAAQSLLGRTFRLTQHFGEAMHSQWAERVFATYHPSAILRAPDHDERLRMRKEFVKHLKIAAAA